MPSATMQPLRGYPGSQGESGFTSLGSDFPGGFASNLGPRTQPQWNDPYASGSPGGAGAGAYDLPIAYGGWSPAARNAVLVGQDYGRGLSPFLDYLKSEMGRDLEGDLFSKSADLIDTNAREGRRLSENEFKRSGYRGASAQSPFMALQLQLEQAARGGALGSAARSSMLQAQSAKFNLGNTMQRNLASLAQAYLTPAQLQAGSVSRTPVGSVGPSYIPEGINTLASLIGAGT